ncbi:hypothetical protein PG999_001514 [Apiospora kogelbergensis]|uniref:Uncharacterized protein n=1 Tax=Apiospora kogelbergensis TaxID=1337665 RepID=A0AAW0R5K5_9PEZI
MPVPYLHILFSPSSPTDYCIPRVTSSCIVEDAACLAAVSCSGRPSVARFPSWNSSTETLHSTPTARERAHETAETIEAKKALELVGLWVPPSFPTTGGEKELLC